MFQFGHILFIIHQAHAASMHHHLSAAALRAIQVLRFHSHPTV